MLSKKDPNKQARVDRFLAPRSSLDDQRTRLFLKNKHFCKTSDLEHILSPTYLRKKKYVNYLDSNFGVLDLKPKSYAVAEYENLQNDSCSLQPWPCKPRKRRSLQLTSSVLDLPTYSYALMTELLDWGKSDVLVAALGKTYYNWSWVDQTEVSRGYTDNLINACKIEPSKGDVIAFGTINGFELHDMNLCKRFLKRCKYCCINSISHDYRYCEITCLDWSPTGKSFAVGCTCGIVTSHTKDASLINSRKVYKSDSLCRICISPDARFVACSSFVSTALHILTWPELKIYYILMFCGMIRTINWHPWRSSYLCVGSITSMSLTQLTFWSATMNRITVYAPLDTPNHINSALFSDNTGELVMSIVHSGKERHNMDKSALLVLSDPYTVVDMWNKTEQTAYRDQPSERDRIRKMMFSPDGTKLATATAAEDLMIWHYLPEPKKKTTRNLKKFCKLPMFVDQADLGFSIR